MWLTSPSWGLYSFLSTRKRVELEASTVLVSQLSEDTHRELEKFAEERRAELYSLRINVNSVDINDE